MKNLEPRSVIVMTRTCVFLACFYQVLAIKCYQCSSSEDPKGEDHCGAYAHYDKTKNTAVECLGERPRPWAPFATSVSCKGLGALFGMVDGGAWSGAVPRSRNEVSTGAVTGATIKMAFTGKNATVLKTAAMVQTSFGCCTLS
uniref:Putative secreted protein n=1 Tax=Amblyomma tuberculatum TaxID=48802 RepID=A0A6M2E3K4_9ACAR